MMAAIRPSSQNGRLAQIEGALTACLSQIASLQQDVSALRRELHGMRSLEPELIPSESLSDPIVSGLSAHDESQSMPESSPGTAALRWLESHYDELVRDHSGEALAIFDGRVVAAHRDLEIVVRMAREEGCEDALFTSIPLSTATYRV
jgi:hypothetical protein